MGTALESLLLSGNAAFLPKHLEVLFHITAGEAPGNQSTHMAHSKNFLTLVGVQNFFPHFFHIFALTGPRNDGNMLWIC